MSEYFLGIDVSKGYADFIILDNKKILSRITFSLTIPSMDIINFIVFSLLLFQIIPMLILLPGSNPPAVMKTTGSLFYLNLRMTCLFPLLVLILSELAIALKPILKELLPIRSVLQLLQSILLITKTKYLLLKKITMPLYANNGFLLSFSLNRRCNYTINWSPCYIRLTRNYFYSASMVKLNGFCSSLKNILPQQRYSKLPYLH